MSGCHFSLNISGSFPLQQQHQVLNQLVIRFEDKIDF
jgi:hypothetical protein